MYNHFWKYDGEKERHKEKSWVGSWTALSKSCIKYGCCALEIAADGGCVGNRYGNSVPTSTTLVTSHHIASRARVVADPLIRAASPVSYPYLIPLLHSKTSLDVTKLREERPHVSLPVGNHDDAGNGGQRTGAMTHTNPKNVCLILLWGKWVNLISD